VVFVKDLADSAIVYEIKVWIEDHSLFTRVLSDVRAHAWYAVRRAGMEIPYPQITVHHAVPSGEAAAARAAAVAALRAHKIFGFLSSAQTEALVRESTVTLFAAAEPVIEQGAPGASMFLLVRGTVEVRLARDGQSAVVAKLGPGDCFGEMSLLTGEPRTATVVATEAVEAVEIAKPAVAALLSANPEVIGRLSELLAQRQLANAQRAATTGTAVSPEQVRSGMLQKLQSFFRLAG